MFYLTAFDIFSYVGIYIFYIPPKSILEFLDEVGLLANAVRNLMNQVQASLEEAGSARLPRRFVLYFLMHVFENLFNLTNSCKMLATFWSSANFSFVAVRRRKSAQFL